MVGPANPNVRRHLRPRREQGGNGGFVETSGKNILDFQGLVDLRAPHGAAGTLLLDPTDITIDAGSSTSDVTLPGSAPFTITGTNATSTLSVADLEAELGLGNVTVATSSGATAPDAGNITVAAPVSWGNANSLTLAADHGININAPITAAAGTLVLTAASGDITQALGGSIPAAISVTSLSASAPAGVVSLAEPTNNVTGLVAGVGQQGFALVNSAGISVGTVGSVVGITSNGSVGLTATGGDITQSSSGGLIVAPAVAAVASVGSVDLEDPGNAIGVIAGSAYGTLGFTLVENTSFSVGTVPGVGGTASVTGITSSNPIPNASGVILQTSTAGDITIEAPVDAGSASVRVSALNGAVVQGSAGLITGGTLRLNAGTAGVGSSGAPLRTAVSTLATSSSDGAFYLSNTGDLTVNNVTAAGAVNINSGGSLNTGSAMACDCSARITAGSTVTLAAHDSITINAGFNVAAGDGAVTLYAGYDAASATYTNSTSTLTINEDVTGSSATPAPGGVSGTSVNMFSGGAISVTGAVTGAVTQTPPAISDGPAASDARSVHRNPDATRLQRRAANPRPMHLCPDHARMQRSSAHFGAMYGDSIGAGLQRGTADAGSVHGDPNSSGLQRRAAVVGPMHGDPNCTRLQRGAPDASPMYDDSVGARLQRSPSDFG